VNLHTNSQYYVKISNCFVSSFYPTASWNRVGHVFNSPCMCVRHRNPIERNGRAEFCETNVERYLLIPQSRGGGGDNLRGYDNKRIPGKPGSRCDLMACEIIFYRNNPNKQLKSRNYNIIPIPPSAAEKTTRDSVKIRGKCLFWIT